MLSDGIKLLGTSVAENFTIENGTSLPASGNNTGELFYLTTGQAGLYVYNGSAWVAAGTGGDGGSATTLAATGSSPRSGTTSGVYAGVDSNVDAVMTLTSTRSPANNRVTQMYTANDGIFRVALSNDALSSTSTVFSITRSANTATNITLTSNAVNLSGLSSGLQVNGSAGTSGQVLTSNGTAAPTWQTVSATLPGTVTTSPIFNGVPSVNTTVPGVQIGRNSGGSSGDSQILLTNSNAAANQKLTRISSAFGSGANGDFIIDLVDDAYSAANPFLRVGRSGNTVGTVTLTGATINLAGLATGGLQLNGAAGTSGQVLTSNGAGAAPTWSSPSVTGLNGTGTTNRAASVTGLYAGTVSAQPGVTWINGAAATGNRSWTQWVDSSVNQWKMSLESDNQSSAMTVMAIARSANTATSVTFTSTAFNLAVGTGGLQLNGSAGTSGQVLTSQGASAAPIWSSVASTALNGTSAPLTQAVNGVYAGYGSYAFMRLINAGLGTDNKAIGIYNDPSVGSFNLSFINDALTGQTPFMTVTRSGQNAVLMTFTTPTATFSGALNAAGVNVTGTTVPANGIYLPAANTLALSTNSSVAVQFNSTNAVGFGGANYGTSGQVLTSQGSGAAPIWSTPSGSSTTLSATAASPHTGTVTGIYGGLDSNSDPVLTITDTRATSGTRVYQQYIVNSGALNHAFSNDALNSTTPFMVFNRVDATNTMSSMNITGGAFVFTPVSTGASNTGAASSLVAAPGGTTAGNGGTMTIGAGGGGSAGAGGQLNLNGGAASSAASTGGGSVVITAGNGSTNATGGNGGDVNLTAGGGGPSATGGNIRLQSAAQNATASSGFITIITGNGGATSGNTGRVDVFTGSSSSGSTGAISLKTGNTSTGGTSGAAQLTTGTAVGNNSGAITISTGNTNGATSGAVTISTGNGTTTDSSTGAVTISTGNAFGAGTPGSMTIGTGTSSQANGADLVLRAGTTTDTSTGTGHVYIRTNTSNAALSLFKQGRFAFGQSTLPNEVLRAFGPAVEVSNKQYLFTVGDNTAAVDSTSRVRRQLQVYTSTADNTLVLYNTSNHISSLNGQNSFNPLAIVAHSLSSSGGSWADYEICRFLPFHATANGGSAQGSAVLIGATAHTQNGVLQVLAPSSAGIADLYSAGHAFSRIRSTQANSLASMFFQNSTTGSTTTDGFQVGMLGSNVSAQLWNYESGFISLGTNNTEVARVNAANISPATTGTIALGTTGLRYSTAYFSGAIDTSSDRNLKQDIEDLSEAELAVAVKVKKLFKKYRLKADVARHGDAARKQIGVIAQDVWAAFESEGLNPAEYNVVKNNVWYALDGEVVEADVEGAVEVSEMSVSYEQLLAFVIAAM